MNEKDLMERYIYDVVRRVPQNTREEIKLELQSLIEDMCAEEQLSMEEVLQKLGDPAKMAKRYREQESYVIGPDYYDNYIWVCKIVLLSVLIASALSAFGQAVVAGVTQESGIVGGIALAIAEFLGEFLATAISSIFGGIGAVTIIFAVMEHQKVKFNIMPDKNWSVDDLSKNVATVNSWTPALLPKVPDKRAVISRGGCMVSIVFTIVFATLLAFAPEVFSSFRFSDGKIMNAACLFNLEKWGLILPVFLVALAVNLVDQIVRLVTGYYCKVVMVSNIICNTIQMVCAVTLIKFMPLFNPNYEKQVEEVFGNISFSKGDIFYYWGTPWVGNIILLFILLFTIGEMIETVYKTVKYAK